MSQRVRELSTAADREDEDAVERPLPEEMLQMIFSRLPFPSLRKLQGVSKTWKDIYSSALHSATLQGRLFRTDLLSVSNRWPQFCPVFVTSQPHYHSFWGFNQSTRMWQQIHKRIRRSFRDPNRVGQTQQRILFGKLSGALMCLVQRAGVENAPHVYLKQQLLELMVVNIFTEEYKVLPPLTEAEVRGHPERVAAIFYFFPDLEHIKWGLRCPEGFAFTYDAQSEGYKVYLMYESTHHEENRWLGWFESQRILLFEYRSTTGAWTAILSDGQRNPHRLHFFRNTSSIAYLDGALYTLSSEPMRVWKYCPANISEAYCYRSLVLEGEHEIKSLNAWGFAEIHNMLIVAIVIDNVAYVYEVDKQTLEWTVISVSSIEREQERKEGYSSTDSETEADLKRKGKRQKELEGSSSGTKSEEKLKENSSGTPPKEDGETSKTNNEASSTESERPEEVGRRSEIISPHYYIVSDSNCVYFWPHCAAGNEALVYSVIENEWSILRIPKMKEETEMQFLAGRSRPGEMPFALV